MNSLHYVVAGGNRGIGLALVHKMVDRGHRVTVLSRSRGLLPNNPMVHHISCDLTTDAIQDMSLPDDIDGLVYCPGSIVLKPFKTISEAQYLEDFNINFLGAVRCIKATMDSLKKSQNNPSIVLFSTVAVGMGMPFHASIAAAKGAVEGLTRSLAAELATSIRVNAIAPSLTQTDLAAKILSSPEKITAAQQRHPLKSIGQPEDLANMAYFLLSAEAKWISGQIMHVDGGMSALKV